MTIEPKIIKNKVGLLELARQLGNVSRACNILGYSRDANRLEVQSPLKGLVLHFLGVIFFVTSFPNLSDMICAYSQPLAGSFLSHGLGFLGLYWGLLSFSGIESTTA